MEGIAGHTYPELERWLAQWAYYVGPNIPYPGFVRDTPVPALPLVGLLLLAGLVVGLGWRRLRA